MRILVLTALLMLGACDHKLVVKVGPPTHHSYPQDSEQCRAQPDLDWCK